MPRRHRKSQLDFFEELSALDTGFFQDMEAMLSAEAEEKRAEDENQERRAINMIKAKRIYPRLQIVERFDPWKATSYIANDFFGNNKERVKATRVLHEKKERLRWFLRALYVHLMFDVPIPHATKYMGLKYSRHRKWILKRIREHKRDAKKLRRTTKAMQKESQQAKATRALDALKKSATMARLRNEKEGQDE